MVSEGLFREKDSRETEYEILGEGDRLNSENKFVGVEGFLLFSSDCYLCLRSFFYVPVVGFIQGEEEGKGEREWEKERDKIYCSMPMHLRKREGE